MLLTWMAVALLVAARGVPVRAEHVQPGMSDPEERNRFRRELRQAHRERMLGARDSVGSEQPSSGPLLDSERPGRWHERFRHHESVPNPPEPPRTRTLAEPPTPRVGRMPLTEGEREQLRQQIREHRYSRRSAASSPDTASPGGVSRE